MQPCLIACLVCPLYVSFLLLWVTDKNTVNKCQNLGSSRVPQRQEYWLLVKRLHFWVRFHGLSMSGHFLSKQFIDQQLASCSPWKHRAAANKTPVWTLVSMEKCKNVIVIHLQPQWRGGWRNSCAPWLALVPAASVFSLSWPSQTTSRDADSGSGLGTTRALLDKEPVQEGNVFQQQKDGGDEISHSEFIKMHQQRMEINGMWTVKDAFQYQWHPIFQRFRPNQGRDDLNLTWIVLFVLWRNTELQMKPRGRFLFVHI